MGAVGFVGQIRGLGLAGRSRRSDAKDVEELHLEITVLTGV